MLAEAKREAERLVSEARDRAEREASEQEVVKQAERQAAQILEEARLREREVRLGAEDYADEVLGTLEVNLGKFLAAVQRGREKLQGKAGSETGSATGTETGTDSVPEPVQGNRRPGPTPRRPPMSTSPEPLERLDLRTLDLVSGAAAHVEGPVPIADLVLGGQVYRRRPARARGPRRRLRGLDRPPLPAAAPRRRRRALLALPGGEPGAGARRRPRVRGLQPRCRGRVRRRPGQRVPGRRHARRVHLGPRRGRRRAAALDPLPRRLPRPLPDVRRRPQRRPAAGARRPRPTIAGPRSARSPSAFAARADGALRPRSVQLTPTRPWTSMATGSSPERRIT